MLYNESLIIPESLTDEALNVQLMAPRTRYSLRVKPEDFTAAKKASGLSLPSKIGKTAISKDIMSIRLGPDELFLSAPSSKSATLDSLIEKISKGFTVSAVDISHCNIGLKISGSGAQSALQVGIASDLDIAALPVGTAMRTLFESAPVLVRRASQDVFHVECWRSFAPYLRDFLAIIAKDRQMADAIQNL